MTKEQLDIILENAIKYYKNGIQEKIDLIKEEYSKLDLNSKQSIYVIEFAESVGYDYSNDI